MADSDEPRRDGRRKGVESMSVDDLKAFHALYDAAPTENTSYQEQAAWISANAYIAWTDIKKGSAPDIQAVAWLRYVKEEPPGLKSFFGDYLTRMARDEDADSKTGGFEDDERVVFEATQKNIKAHAPEVARCPYPTCDQFVQGDWNFCPGCGRPISAGAKDRTPCGTLPDSKLRQMPVERPFHPVESDGGRYG